VTGTLGLVFLKEQCHGPAWQKVAAEVGCWRQLVQQWRQSGLMIRVFCQRHGVSEPSFYSWRRRIEAEADGDSAAADRRARSDRACHGRHEALGDSKAGFAEVRPTEPNEVNTAADAQGIELTLLTGERLRIGWDVDAAQIQRVMVAVREVHGC
jgi:transposase-like protein